MNRLLKLLVTGSLFLMPVAGMAEDFHGIPVYPGGRTVEKIETSYALYLTVVSKDSQDEILRFYQSKLGKPLSINHPNNLTEYQYKNLPSAPTVGTVSIRVSDELDGTELVIGASPK